VCTHSSHYARLGQVRAYACYLGDWHYLDGLVVMVRLMISLSADCERPKLLIVHDTSY
jgi:hypothetical protein